MNPSRLAEYTLIAVMILLALVTLIAPIAHALGWV